MKSSNMIYVSSARVVDNKSLPVKSVNKDKISDRPTFYSTIKPVVILAGFFGIIPLGTSKLRYRFLSIKVAYTLLVLAVMTAVSVVNVKSTFNTIMTNVTNAKEMTAMLAGLVFRISAAFSLAYFWYVATRLPDLLNGWEETSKRLIKYVDTNKRPLHYPAKYMALISAVLLLSAFLDRALHDARFVNTDIMCANVTINVTVDSYADCYLIKNGEYLIGVLGFHQWATAAALLINIFTSFIWNFLDLFIILISCGLYHNFVHINVFLEQNKRCRFRPEEWKSLREDHLAVSKLVESVDRVLSLGVLYCYTANLISICTQMFLGLRPKTSAIFETSYTTVSFLHLVGRTAAVTWTASRIHDAHQIPLKYIHACSSSSYCSETKRFRAHIIETPSSLSGCRFFFVTRSFFLGIVSVVITYEVIFLELK